MSKKFKIHQEGRRILMVTGLSLFILNLLAQILLHSVPYLNTILLALSALVFLFVASFFRHPGRKIVPAELSILAPADGKVVVMEEVMETEYFNEKRLQLSIFMSPLNVHVNRYPISGEIAYTKYHPGTYLVAWHPKSSTLNERNTIVIKHKQGEILVRQIAGKFAKKIVSYADVGHNAQQGEELGFIKFGSRVDMLLPLNTVLKVKINQKVRGGETVLGHLH